MDREDLINQLIEDTQEVKQTVKDLSELSMEELSYKPSVDQWSVLQCVEHLNIADEHYLLQFEDKLPNASKSSNQSFQPGLLGRYFVKMIRPLPDGTIPSPMKTFRKFIPQVDVKYDTIERFIADQDRIINFLKIAGELNLNSNKIPSAIGTIIMFKLGDAFRFLIGHNQRHVQQMKNVLQELDNHTKIAS